MGYNTYWDGHVHLEPALTPAEIEALDNWLGADDSSHIITADDVIEAFAEHNLTFRTPYDPFSTISDRKPVDCLYIESQTHTPEEMGIVLQGALNVLTSMGKKITQLIAYWDGDETGDMGCIKLKDDKLWLCPADIIYAEPGDDESELIEL